MRISAFAVFAACFLSACTTPTVNDSSPADREVAFSCANGESVAVRFFPNQGAAVLVRNSGMVELKQQPSGSGFIYSNGSTTIRGKGDDLTLETGRMAPILCKAH